MILDFEEISVSGDADTEFNRFNVGRVLVLTTRTRPAR